MIDILRTMISFGRDHPIVPMLGTGLGLVLVGIAIYLRNPRW